MQPIPETCCGLLKSMRPKEAENRAKYDENLRDDLDIRYNGHWDYPDECTCKLCRPMLAYFDKGCPYCGHGPQHSNIICDLCYAMRCRNGECTHCRAPRLVRGGMCGSYMNRVHNQDRIERAKKYKVDPEIKGHIVYCGARWPGMCELCPGLPPRPETHGIQWLTWALIKDQN